MPFLKGRSFSMQTPSPEQAYRISVRQLLLRPDETRRISVTLDAETTESYGLRCRELPSAEGILENRAGVLMLRYTLHAVPELTCDRCLSPVEVPCEEQFSHVIVTETADRRQDAEYLLAPDAMLDLAEAVMTDLRLSLPTRILCRPDCKGLCPSCGQDLNLGECSCGCGSVTVQYDDQA
ncbi:MAG: DUF177 domain-containing protein [Oscillospiraceae bacterium]|nr:DUF177 domain-containing protein [Oscillospiraceae bacterium]